MASDYKIVDRGDVVLVNFDPQSGMGIKGNRYALVLSPVLFNKHTGYVSLCPITNTKRDFGFEVDIPENKVKIKRSDVEFFLTGVILTHQLKNLDARSRRLKVVGKMTDDVTSTCLHYVNSYLS